MVVSGAMEAGKYEDELLVYSGTEPMHKSCTWKIDHQVTFVGYGKKDETDVWVIRNSWGKDWGANGNIYVPVGANSFCTESYAYAVIPENADFTKLVDRGKQDRGFFKWEYLDPDSNETMANDGSFNGMQDHRNSEADIIVLIVICVIVFVVLVVAIAVLAWCYCNKNRKIANSSDTETLVEVESYTS